ncbi:YybH family protein [Halobacillus massiliensis]|uniref:YybH family protein n=1 Tax=Halobacillus massiliensis TaxID=1926286 RepID=UPI0009E1EFD9|nr:nuclear transport factor 2 family protein [Halobacillus massiliensis]
MANGRGSVQELLDTYKNAVNERNVEKLLSAYTSDIHIYDCWENWECNGKESWQVNVVEWFNGLKEEGNILKVDFNDVVIEELANIAFVHCAVTYTAYPEESEEKLRQTTNRFTFGLKKVDNTWLIKHEHSSLPIDLENGKGMFNLR